MPSRSRHANYPRAACLQLLPTGLTWMAAARRPGWTCLLPPRAPIGSPLSESSRSPTAGTVQAAAHVPKPFTAHPLTPCFLPVLTSSCWPTCLASGSPLGSSNLILLPQPQSCCSSETTACICPQDRAEGWFVGIRISGGIKTEKKKWYEHEAKMPGF